MPYVFSQVATSALPTTALCVEDLRMAPVRGRNTTFRLLQQNMLAYTFDSFIPGFATSGVLNSTDFVTLVAQPLTNADLEGALRFGADYTVNSNAQAKVAGDIFEVLTHAIMWNIAERWNRYMCGQPWPTTPRFPRPKTPAGKQRQIAALNLPRGYDWVRLLVPSAQHDIDQIRIALDTFHGLAMPTSTPDIAVVTLPDSEQGNPLWHSQIGCLDLANQATLRNAYSVLEGKVEPEDLILAIAVKRSLRSDRLYQPLYEANVMQLLLEGFLGAPRVEFEVQTLSLEGTAAEEIYRAASLFGVAQEQAALRAAMQTPSPGVPAAAASSATIHRAVRALYQPANARELAERFLQFLNGRLALVP